MLVVSTSRILAAAAVYCVCIAVACIMRGPRKGNAMAVQTKSWYFSRTILFNSLTAAAVILTAMQGQEFLRQYPRLLLSMTVLTAFINIVLRTITSKPLTKL